MERHPLREELQCLPMDNVVDLQRHERIAREHPARLAFVSSRRSRWRTAVSGASPLPDVDPRPDLLLRLGERVLVVQVEPEEGGHVEPFACS